MIRERSTLVAGGGRDGSRLGWLRYGNPWEIDRTGTRFRVQFGGRVQRSIDDAGQLVHEWVAILNVAKMGKFSSDHTIQEYAVEIWRVTSVRI